MRKGLIIGFICILLTSLLCYYNATQINTKQITVRQEILRSQKIDEDTDGLLIAYFSDLYYGSFIDHEYIDSMANKLNSYHPDLIIFGGDMFESSIANKLVQEDIDYLVHTFKSLNAPLGKFAILGDQDTLNTGVLENIYNQSDFEILSNSNKKIGIDKNSFINIVGINPLVSGNPDPALSFTGVNSSAYTLVVSHCPDIFDDLSSYEFDYMLAGHSLGGQIYIPLISLFTRNEGCKKYYTGKITKYGKTMDITNGVGRINNDARFLADAQIVLYTLSTD